MCRGLLDYAAALFLQSLSHFGLLSVVLLAVRSCSAAPLGDSVARSQRPCVEVQTDRIPIAGSRLARGMAPVPLVHRLCICRCSTGAILRAFKDARAVLAACMRRLS